MRFLLLSIFLLAMHNSFCQAFSYPVIQQRAQDLNAVIPNGWALLDSATGDLNKDGLADAALVLQHRDSVLIVNEEKDTVTTQPRMLLIFFKNEKSGFDLAAQSNSFILQHERATMDDPFEMIRIQNGVLQLSFRLFFNVGSWYVTTSSYKFRYGNGQFVLIGADYMALHRASLDYEEYSYNFLTRKRSHIKGNEEKGTKQQAWKTFQLAMPQTLKTFKKPFTWEVEKNIFL